MAATPTSPALACDDRPILLRQKINELVFEGAAAFENGPGRAGSRQRSRAVTVEAFVAAPHLPQRAKDALKIQAVQRQPVEVRKPDDKVAQSGVGIVETRHKPGGAEITGSMLTSPIEAKRAASTPP